MKATVKALSCLLLLALLLPALAACDSSGSVASAFRGAGYEVKEYSPGDGTAPEVLLGLGYSEEEIGEFSEYRLLIASKSRIPLAMIVVFPSGGKLRSFLDGREEGGYAAAKEEGRVRRNAYLAYAAYGTVEIFGGK